MCKFLFHASVVVVVLACIFGVWLLALAAQVPPTGPVVQMNTPIIPTVQLFADGSVILPPLPASTVLRVPPQDSNDVGMIFNQFGRAVCGTAPVPAACATFKITVGK